MAKRAAICIGVNRAGTLPTLQAAAKGAIDFETWAKAQGCETTLLIDDSDRKIQLVDIFDVVQRLVDSRIYDQLIIYFSGHGILQAPGVEFWLLSRAPENANEAVNLPRSIENARNSGIPHLVFVSDACRSSVTGPPLNGVIGGSIFPNAAFGPKESEVDIFYATRPGDPAWEVAIDKAIQDYRGIFTDSLLATVTAPQQTLVEEVMEGSGALSVVTSRKLQGHLEATVPLGAAVFDVRIRQTPRIRVETALPKFFAVVNPGTVQYPRRAFPSVPPGAPTLDAALAALGATHFEEGAAARPPQDSALAVQLGFTAEVENLAASQGRSHFETHTGFTVRGAIAVMAETIGWQVDLPFADYQDPNVWHVRLVPAPIAAPASLVLTVHAVAGGITGTVVAVLPEFIGTLVVDDAGRVTSLNYVPSDNSWRYPLYQARAAQIERMKAFATVAARHGRFTVENEPAAVFAGRARQDKAIDPTLGVYAAYAYAQAGQFADVDSVFGFMRDDDPSVAVPFDVAMLATRYRGNQGLAELSRYAPFAPMLSQGWALLAPGDPMFQPIHAQLRSHLIPSLWTTLDPVGAQIAAVFIRG